MTTIKKPPGRPKKSTSEQLEQFSIRLTPRLKLGLEMLAKVQGRSLSQAVEWAIKVGLNTQRLPPNDKYMFLGELLDDLAGRDEFKRLLTLYLYAPSLLSFEEAAAMQLVNESYEWNLACDADHKGDDGDTHRKRYYDYAEKHWPAIKAEAARKADNGESLTNGFIGLLTGDHFEV
ncbi:hypothetical protein ACQKIE_01060 [Luteibacter sp. NPDC031894]|uniref:hypothetical protein n=1 Tax=Luteibacter sp. NPDC031894 TaxID=3390572 RepID=UPI003D085211